MEKPALLAILFCGACSGNPIQSPEVKQAGLTCADAKVAVPPEPISLAGGRRVNYYEPMKRTICQVTVEIDPVVLRTKEEYGCYPQQSLTISSGPVTSLLIGASPERLELPICGAANLGPDPAGFVRPGPRPASAEVGVSRAYQFGPDANGVLGNVGGPGTCYIGIYETISVTLADVEEPERSRLPFTGYAYREIEQRSASECDALIDAFRSH